MKNDTVYCIEGNVVDRISNKNGKGWCETVSPTLNTQDRHAVCFQMCTAPDKTSDTVDVIALEGNGARPSHLGKGFSEDGKMYTLNTIEQHSVCYGVDCRNLCLNKEVSATLQAKNVGGFSYNYLNPVLVENNEMKCYAIENHPNDSRCNINNPDVCQALSARMGTGGNNTPFVLIDQDGTSDINDTFIMNSSGDGISTTIDASYYKGQGQRQGIEREYVMMNPVCVGNGQLVQAKIMDKVNCLDCMHDQKMIIMDGEKDSTLKQICGTERKYVLRRLTPTECAKLQGFPEWWCDDAKGSDSAQYKLWGNGVALPCVALIIGNIVEDMQHEGKS